MSTKLISIIIGLVIVLGTGTAVYTNKKPAYVPAPLKTDTENSQTPTPAPVTSTKNDDDEDEDDDSVTNTPVSATTPTPPVKPETPSGITLAQVAEHNSRTSCWSAINGSVYDLTSWIPNHPGGEQAILSMCGIDGSAGYNGQHSGSKKTTTILGGFKLGALAK